ncbi:Phosphomannomutase [Penicillium argentinense]|uniref:Phosphomannomutase n=1 Tax=Penicillium argentinense TaxID=1131581 RepID=A0A9W9EQ02_9EURO|nr:Phosphomannomutase [Penicillium argentinense]KAJ5085659.1 Phosphomannomutase [Penicillium argentinense]
MATAAGVYSSLENRPLNTIYLFDVDETLAKARRTVQPEMLEFFLVFATNALSDTFVIPSRLSDLSPPFLTHFQLGGSNIVEQHEQQGSSTTDVTTLFDFCFPEKVRGTFVEFRNGMINVSPIGRNASVKERNNYGAYAYHPIVLGEEHHSLTSHFRYDKAHNIGKDFVEALKNAAQNSFSIGGQISFDVLPTGWDMTYCLQHVAAEKDISGVECKSIPFFGDKCSVGGSDYEIYEDARTIGHTAFDPDDTMKQLNKIFDL